MSDERQVRQQIVVQVTPEQAFEALTKASELREWFSDGAWTQVRPGGRYALHWDDRYHVEGRFVDVEVPRRAVVDWHGTAEPAPTRAEFTVAQAEGAVEVAVVHGGYGTGPEWDAALAESERGWATGLENLRSTLETGIDLRVSRRPFLGVIPEALDAERAAREGIAVTQGIYLHGSLEGTGARAAGLDKGDVIVAMDGIPTPGYSEFEAVVRRHRAGDVVELEVVHGGERRQASLTLGQRPSHPLPADAEELARFLSGEYGQTDAELKAAFEGVTDEEAARSPAEGEWSAKQVLAHVIAAERDLQHYFAAVAVDGWLDGGDGNPTAIPGRLAAVISASPTLGGLVDCFIAAEEETVGLLRGLPPEALSHKARLFRITQTVVFLSLHTRDHIGQIQRAVQAARAGTPG